MFVQHQAICTHQCEGPQLCRLPKAHEPNGGKRLRRSLVDATDQQGPATATAVLRDLHTSLSAKRAALQRAAPQDESLNVDNLALLDDASAEQPAVPTDGREPDSRPIDAVAAIAPPPEPVPAPVMSPSAPASGSVAGALFPTMEATAAQQQQLAFAAMMQEMRQQARQEHLALMGALTAMTKALDPANATARQSAQAKRRSVPDQAALMEHLKARLATEAKQLGGVRAPAVVQMAVGGIVPQPDERQQVGLQRLVDEAGADMDAGSEQEVVVGNEEGL